MELESPPIQTGQDNIYTNTRFAFFCFASRRRSSWWERVRSTSFSQPRSHEPTLTGGDRWWTRGIRAFKKIREWSEIVAGPKWKTFIRSLNRNNRNAKRMPNYHYDPLSYALNFDEGQNGDSQHHGYRNFSTRYAVATVKTVSTEQGNDVAVLVN